MSPFMQHAAPTMILAVYALLTGCASDADGSERAEESSASAPTDQRFSYSFVASRRHSEPSSCGAYMLAMQLVFEDELHKVSAIIASQAWSCELHEEASTFDITCASPVAEGAAIEASLSIVLFEPAPKTKLAGEATLTIRTDSGSCEHSYALDGQLDD